MDVAKGQAWIPREDPSQPPAEVVLCLEVGDGKSWTYYYETDIDGDPRRQRFKVGEEPAPDAGEVARWLWYPRGTNLLDVSIDVFPRFDDRAACVADAWSWARDDIPPRMVVEVVGPTWVWLTAGDRRITMPLRTLLAGWKAEGE